MKLTLLVSPGTWDLIARLRPHLDLAIELFDISLVPLLPERDDPVSRRLRALPQEPGSETGSRDAVVARDRLASAMRTGSHQVFASGGLRIGVFPLRRERTVVGLLVAAAEIGEAQAPAGGRDVPGGVGTAEGPADGAAGLTSRAIDDPVARRIERIGWSLRAAIEADIDTRGQLGSEQERSRWLATTLRFLEHLYECATEEELAHTLVQAAAIWGDVDARLYRWDLDGRFVLHTVLPAAAREASPAELPSSLAEAPQGVTRLSSLAELEHLGWHGPHEVLLMTVPGPGGPHWILAVAGSVDARLERVLAVACRTLGSCLERIEAERARALGERLLRRLGERGSRFPLQVAAVLGEVAQAVGASWARILAVESDGGPARVLATVGGAPLASLAVPLAAEHTFLSAERMLFPLYVGLSRPALLELGATGGLRFGPGSVRLAESAAGVLTAWLAGAFQGLAIGGLGLDVKETSAFEARIQDEIERARRFNLQAGLIVIDTVETSRDRHALALQPMIEALRSQLRASDLVGRLKDGHLAALLVQTDPRGVAVVAGRVEARLARMAAEERLPETVLGRAAYPTAGETAAALVAAAKEDLARRAAPLLDRSSPRSSLPNLRAVR